MDSITHIALGACIGEAMLGRQLRKKALVAGAVAQSLPDIDSVAVLWLAPADNLLTHRGLTHSIFFVLSATVFLSFLMPLFSGTKNVSRSRWIAFLLIQFSTHLFIDLFNNYGTGILEPFDQSRFSFNALYVADPFFSVWAITACIALAIMAMGNSHRKFWANFAFIGSAFYLGYCVLNKTTISSQIENTAKAQLPGYREIFTTPAPLNNWLWFVAVKTDSGFYTGYRSVFSPDAEMDLRFVPRNEALLSGYSQLRELSQLKKFSGGWYTIERRHDTLVFNDLRFGQVIGWHDPQQRFAFHYYLGMPAAANKLVVQRGRFAKWSSTSTRSMIREISGR